MIIFLLFPLLFFIFTCRLLNHLYKEEGARFAFLGAWVIWGVAVVMATEGLSLFHGLTVINLTFYWIIADGILLFILKKNGWLSANWFSAFSFWGKLAKSLALEEKIVAGMSFAIVLVVCFVGLWSAPNNWDSMTYHLSRVMHWMQNRSIEYHPTHITRQLHSAPLAEWMILQLQIFSGGKDHLVSLVQFMGWIVSAAGVSLLVRIWRGSPLSQLIAAFLVFTLPMAILQGSSTQNDLVVASFIVCFVAFMLKDLAQPRRRNVVLLALAGALALLTKGTAYIFLLPFIGMYFLQLFNEQKKNFWLKAAIIVGIMLTLNAGFYLRNISYDGRALSTGEIKLRNETISPMIALTHLGKNILFQLGVAPKPVNEKMVGLVNQVDTQLGIKPTDERIFFSPFHLEGYSTNEDVAVNPLQVLLLFVTAVLCVVHFRKNPLPAYLLGGVLLGLILFSTLLKWQLFHSRLELPLLIIAMAALAYYWERFPKVLQYVLTAALFIYAVPFTVNSYQHSLIAKPKNILNLRRADKYFLTQPDRRNDYYNVVNILKTAECNRIGLVASENDWEYPLWVLLQEGKANVEIRHLLVDNLSAKYQVSEKFMPCAVVDLTKTRPPQFAYKNMPLVGVWQGQAMNIYLTPSAIQTVSRNK